MTSNAKATPTHGGDPYSGEILPSAADMGTSNDDKATTVSVDVTLCACIQGQGKKTFLQRQVKTAIRKSKNWRDLLERLEKMYPVYETDLSVRRELEELPMLPSASERTDGANRPHICG